MFQDRLDDITNFIMEHNQYFGYGFSSVHLDEKTGYVADDKTVVFPNDTLGDYFYLRLPKNVSFAYGQEYNMGSCADGIASRTEVILVAIVKNASPDVLLSNMVDTMRQYREARITLKSAIYQKEYALLQELKNIKEENQLAALQRMPVGSAFVSFTFEIIETILPTKLNCLPNPCVCS